MLILTTRKYAKRPEKTCGYAAGVDGINAVNKFKRGVPEQCRGADKQWRLTPTSAGVPDIDGCRLERINARRLIAVLAEPLPRQTDS
jgi:hypothetical protein